MKKMTVLLAGSLLGTLIVLSVATTTLAQYPVEPPVAKVRARGYKVYRYPEVATSNHAYRKAVRFGFVPVAPPTVFGGPSDHYGRPFYGPPYYTYPRPPVGYPGYGGVSGGPVDYRSLVPPPIPRSPTSPDALQSPTVAPEQSPMPPSPSAEAIPAPPSNPETR